jgi:hypothetical protein
MMQHRLAFEVLTRTQLLANNAYIVESFPHADTGYGWGVAADSLVTPYFQIDRTGANTAKTLGGIHFDWTLFPLSKRMWYYLWVEKANYNLTPTVTVLTLDSINNFNEASQWVAVVCKMDFGGLTADILQPQGELFFTPQKVKFFDGYYAAP